MSATTSAALAPTPVGHVRGCKDRCFDAHGVPLSVDLLRQLVAVMEAGNCSRDAALSMIRCKEHELGDARG